MSNNENGNCDCNQNSKWLQIFLTIAPAVLPVIFQKIGDEISDYFRRKRELQEEIENRETDTNSTNEETKQ